MPRLQEFVGTRGHPVKPPVTTRGSTVHPGSKNERMRAIIQGLALSTDPQRSKSVYGSQENALPRQLERDANNISSPMLQAPNANSGSSITNPKWYGHRPVVRASFSTNDPPWHDPDPMEGTIPGTDIFGTDIENLDSTAASSDMASSEFGDIQSHLGEGDIDRGFPTNLNQRLRTGSAQQGRILPKSEHEGFQNDEHVVSLDEDIFLRDRGVNNHTRNVDDYNNNDQRLDEIDRMTRNTDSKVLEPNLNLEGCPRRPHGLLLSTNLRTNSTAALPSVHKTISIRNSMESSTSTINSRATNHADVAFHALHGESDVRSLRAGEPRREKVEGLKDIRRNMEGGSSCGKANRMNALQSYCYSRL